jgi:hypothetical protein
MQRIINTVTLETVWRGSEYLVDGIPATVDPPLYLLTDATRPAPSHDATTQRLRHVAAHADLGAGEWVLSSYEIIALTPEEIAENAILAARKIWPNAAAFLSEFTMPELAAISLSLDPTIAALRLLLASWPADIYSDDPRIIGGLGALVAAGIITELSRAEILAK